MHIQTEKRLENCKRKGRLHGQRVGSMKRKSQVALTVEAGIKVAEALQLLADHLRLIMEEEE